MATGLFGQTSHYRGLVSDYNALIENYKKMFREIQNILRNSDFNIRAINNDGNRDEENYQDFINYLNNNNDVISNDDKLIIAAEKLQSVNFDNII